MIDNGKNIYWEYFYYGEVNMQLFSSTMKIAKQ